MWNIVIGLVFLVGGLTGKLALLGTNSPTAISVVGGGLMIWGIIQMVKRREE